MYITPDTYVRLVRFDATKEHQLTFPDESTQKQFFDGLNGITLLNFTYQRKDNVIRYPGLYEDIEKYNYVVYCNQGQSNKNYYCYITNMRYINDEMTEITIETDVFQTWQFDIIYKQMFVEREHVNDDTIGLNTVPEGLETGEYIVNDNTPLSSMNDFCYILYSTKNLSTGADVDEPTNMGGIPVSKRVYVCKDYSTLYTLINSLPALGINTNAITNIFMLPKCCIDYDFTSSVLHFTGQNNPINTHFQIFKPYNLDGYVPNNGKMFTYPYCYLAVSNNLGNTNILRYEEFKGTECTFEFYAIPTQNSPAKVVPTNYGKLNIENELEAIISGKYPTLDWNEAYYSNWLLSNSQNLSNKEAIAIGTTMIGVGGLVAGIMTGGLGLAIAGAGGAISGLSGITNVLGQYEAHENIPNSSHGNTAGGDIMTATNKNLFEFYEYSVKYEFAKKIDDYFSMAGYKVNSLKIPNVTGRLNWNYVKTIDCNIEGTEIPEKDINELKSMFNRGITFWHNYSTFRDYSQANSIVT